MDTTNGFTNQVNEEKRSPPDYLYYAVGENRVNSIWTDGLYAKGNRYVHLSNNAETALRIEEYTESLTFLKYGQAKCTAEALNFIFQKTEYG